MKKFFAENSVEVLKELFKSCARLIFGRVAGLFDFIYKVSYFLFNGVVELFVCGELGFEPVVSRPAHFSSKNCSAILMNQGVGFLVGAVQRQRETCLSRTEQRWLL